ncbi:hypothetical protein VOLCADRAFT_97021 [Volvox carteri f. nagariensis]|uniref:Uncharacterized protein n=1 Tax=Volvox carteri f. nagariensis TaxID=3068 RepID=D8UBP5_VOLCA|nr:uncharacterized protein VOLCADRAFT_97021 [Volvox carteri f. nagariensis]EFJ42860.1 hypothetical protein VOLCADRAFT_97021 [Volvox carteri f. nagariensis]|eukprot:XP_002956120.1 hypothetical protein VOLCADRAFT_97021 [Volvox carteri f. nagariensis]
MQTSVHSHFDHKSISEANLVFNHNFDLPLPPFPNPTPPRTTPHHLILYSSSSQRRLDLAQGRRALPRCPAAAENKPAAATGPSSGLSGGSGGGGSDPAVASSGDPVTTAAAADSPPWFPIAAMEVKNTFSRTGPPRAFSRRSESAHQAPRQYYNA